MSFFLRDPDNIIQQGSREMIFDTKHGGDIGFGSMRQFRPPPALLRFLKPYDPVIQNLALKLRSLVLEEMAPCYENIYDAYSAVAIGYGWSERFRDGVYAERFKPLATMLGSLVKPLFHPKKLTV